MKPTLEQIYNFGTEKVDREHYTYINDKEYLNFRPAKRYKLGIIYQVCIMYGYSTIAIGKYCEISKNQVGRTISYLRNSAEARGMESASSPRCWSRKAIAVTSSSII